MDIFGAGKIFELQKYTKNVSLNGKLIGITGQKSATSLYPIYIFDTNEYLEASAAQLTFPLDLAFTVKTKLRETLHNAIEQRKANILKIVEIADVKQREKQELEEAVKAAETHPGVIFSSQQMTPSASPPLVINLQPQYISEYENPSENNLNNNEYKSNADRIAIADMSPGPSINQPIEVGQSMDFLLNEDEFKEADAYNINILDGNDSSREGKEDEDVTQFEQYHDPQSTVIIIDDIELQSNIVSNESLIVQQAVGGTLVSDIVPAGYALVPVSKLKIALQEEKSVEKKQTKKRFAGIKFTGMTPPVQPIVLQNIYNTELKNKNIFGKNIERDEEPFRGDVSPVSIGNDSGRKKSSVYDDEQWFAEEQKKKIKQQKKQEKEFRKQEKQRKKSEKNRMKMEGKERRIEEDRYQSKKNRKRDNSYSDDNRSESGSDGRKRHKRKKKRHKEKENDNGCCTLKNICRLLFRPSSLCWIFGVIAMLVGTYVYFFVDNQTLGIGLGIACIGFVCIVFGCFCFCR